MLHKILFLALTSSLAIINNTAFSNEKTKKKELITKNERQEILRVIDNTCADTWCEGDYNFKFTDFSCNPTLKYCELRFHFISTDKNNLEAYSPLQICHFSNIHHKRQIADHNFLLQDKFYDKLNNCIIRLQETIDTNNNLNILN